MKLLKFTTSIFGAEHPHFSLFFSKGVTSISTTVRNTEISHLDNNEQKIMLISPTEYKGYPEDTISLTCQMQF